MTGGQPWRGVFAIPCATFGSEGELDTRQLARQVQFCLESGAHGIAVPLLASEFYTLSDAERRVMLEVTISAVAGSVPVIAGVSGTSTRHAVELATHAVSAGADGLLAMPPYIARLGPDEVIAYFAALAMVGGDRPVMVQNAGPPQPLGFPVETPVLERICGQVPAVRYLKEERTPGPYFLSEVRRTLGDRIEGIFGGRAGLYFIDELRRGAAGTMVAPEFVDGLVRVYEQFVAGQAAEAIELHRRLLPGIAKEVLLGPSFAKRVLRLRGVLEHVGTRSGPDRWDEYEEASLHEVWTAIEPDLPVAIH